MFDNEYVLTENILDSSSDILRDSKSESVLSRAYSDLLKKFMQGIPAHLEIPGKLRDNSNNGIYGLLDSQKEKVLDNKSTVINARGYSSQMVLDSGSNPIDCIGIFVS